MPFLAALIAQAVLPTLSALFAILAPLLGTLLAFTLERIPKIPSYLRLLKTLYSDIEPKSQERKILTGGFLLIANILTFMSYSLIPWTGVPLIGLVTSPIAAAIAIVVALTLVDILFEANKEYYLQKLDAEGFVGVSEIEKDVAKMKELFAGSWKKVKQCVQKGSQEIYDEGTQQCINFRSKPFNEHINNSIEGLSVYVAQDSVPQNQEIYLEQLKKKNNINSLQEITFFGAGAAIGTGAGVGVSALASSIFVKASMWTAIQGLLGMSTGIVVSASTYTLLTLAAPVGLGGLALIGVYSTLIHHKSKQAAAKMSQFLADIMSAALPMAWADGDFSYKEHDAVHQFIVKSGMVEADRNRLDEEIEKQQSFDDIMRSNFIFDEQHRYMQCSQSDEERIKHRLILFTAWEIAVADDVIHHSELMLHNRMADKLGISRDEAYEIRRLINLKHDQNLSMTTKSLGLLEKQVDVRKQYRLKPSADFL